MFEDIFGTGVDMMNKGTIFTIKAASDIELPQ